MHNEKVLLQHVATVCNKFDEILKTTGEAYNLFELLGLSSDEVRLHSTLLADFLNCNGAHGCGSTFLKIFIEQQKQKHSKNPFFEKLLLFNTNSGYAKVEHHIGFKNAEATIGGRIDILVTDMHRNSFIIENKIGAGDQYNQLVRYHNFDSNAPIFYLTLDGKEPSNISSGHLKRNEHYVCLSYKEDIIHWLEACIKEASQKPLLRESLVQYCYLIKKLTNQSTNNKMENELKNLLAANSENVRAMFEISNVSSAVRQYLIKRFAHMLLESYNTRKVSDYQLKFEDNFGYADEYLWLESPTCNYSVNLYFAHDLWNPTIGIAKTSENAPFQNELTELLSNVKLGRNERWGGNWIWVNRYDQLNRYFLDTTQWSEIADNKMSLLESVVDIIVYLAEVIIVVNKEGSSQTNALEVSASLTSKN